MRDRTGEDGLGRRRLCAIANNGPEFWRHQFEASFNEASLALGCTDGSLLKHIVQLNGLTPLGCREVAQQQVRNDASLIDLQRSAGDVGLVGQSLPPTFVLSVELDELMDMSTFGLVPLVAFDDRMTMVPCIKTILRCFGIKKCSILVF